MTDHADEERGQAAVIGIVLLVGLVAVGGIGILLIGGQIQEDTKERAEQARIEQAFLELGRDVNTVSRSDSSERVIDLDLPDDGDSAVREERTGRIWVNRTNYSTQTTSVLVNQSIGSIRYTSQSGPTFAYQAGAVFRQAGNRTQVLSNPGFEYSLNKTGDNPTLTLPVVTTVGPNSIPNGKVRARKVSTKSPINDDIIVENNLVTVTVKSEWYVGWADYFRSLAEKSGSAKSAVTVDHKRQTATLELVVPVTRGSVAAGVVGGASGSTFVFSNNINIDSYDSSECAYDAGCGSKRDEAKIIAGGNLTFEQNGQVDGDVEVGGTLTFKSNVNGGSCPNGGSAVVCGNASYGTLDDNSGSTTAVKGWSNNNASTIRYDPVDSIIDAQVFKIKGNSDNAAEDDIDASTDTFDCSGGCELDSGVYYLEEITGSGDLKGSDLRLDTTGGSITLAVNGSVEFEKTEITIVGDGRVNIYVNSEIGGPCDKNSDGGCDFDWDRGTMAVNNDNATQFWVYTDKDGAARFKGGGGTTNFSGVLFGPGTESNPGTTVGMYNSQQFHGGAVGEVTDIENAAELHFDRSLLDTRTIVATTQVPKLTFLVVTSYVVEVDDD